MIGPIPIELNRVNSESSMKLIHTVIMKMHEHVRIKACVHQVAAYIPRGRTIHKCYNIPFIRMANNLRIVLLLCLICILHMCVSNNVNN